MSNSISCTTSLTIPTLPMLSKAHVNPPPRLSNLSLKSIETPSLREICKHASLREAFESFTSLFLDQNSLQFIPDEAYSSILELCASEKALSQGQQIHSHVIKSAALNDSVFLSTKLVFMYGNCASLLSAEKVFGRMCHRTIFTWNAMIGAYVSNGEPLKALDLYKDMRILGVTLDSCTFPSVLKACSMLKDLLGGAEIHSLAIKLGYVSIVFVLNSLVSMYAKCNDLDAARWLFSCMNGKNDSVSWNSIIAAYSANGQSIEALSLFREMLEVGLSLNTYTYVSALQACENSLFGRLGMEIHAAVLKSNHYLDLYVANALISMYVRCGRINWAAAIFGGLDEKDNVSWNTMLSGFVQNGFYNEALLFFHDIKEAGKKPDKVSILNIISACARLGNLTNGMEVHGYAIRNEIDSDLHVGNSLTDMYAKCSHFNFMTQVFNRMPKKDVISWSTAIAGYTQNNQHLTALELFRKVLQMEGVNVDSMMIGSILSPCSRLRCSSSVKQIHCYTIRRGLSDSMLQNALVDVYGECGYVDYAKRLFGSIETKDVVSWTSMISCYIHNGLPNEAFELFYLMTVSNIEPDDISLVSVLSAAASFSSLKKGEEIHGFLIRKGYMLVGSIASSLLDMYTRCGTIENAYKVFDGIRNKDLILWTAMINATGMHGRGKAAINLFNRMEDERIFPDHITFLALLNACSHSGLIDDGRRFFSVMESKYGIEPWPEHYACLVDLLARANRLGEAYEFVQSMKVKPTAEMWCALLRACLVYSNKELAEIAAEKVLEFDLENPGNYVLVSNAFAAYGRWRDVDKVRMRMKESGLKKNPGCSWIEVGNEIQKFVARDKSHPLSNEIYEKLDSITDKLEKEGGYVPQTKFVMHNVDEKEKVQMLYGHSERLAIAYGLLNTPEKTPIRITKNLRICSDCHTFCKLVSKLFDRELIVRDANRFHHFEDGICSCCDFW